MAVTADPQASDRGQADVAADPQAPATGLQRLRLAQVLGLVTVLPLIVVVGAMVVGIVTLANQSDVRDELVNRVEPANVAAQALETAMVNQETGVRGYELSAISSFLDPFRTGLTAERQAVAELKRARVAGTAASLAQVLHHIEVWERQVALPAIAAVQPGHPGTSATVDTVIGKLRFDQLRASLATLQADVHARMVRVKTELDNAARTTTITFIAIGVALLLSVIAAAIALTRTVTWPLQRLTASSRKVAEGELSTSLLIDGPMEIVELGHDVDTMRQRLVRELEAVELARAELAAAATDLERSNTELEQFAYVASHDLQEPLRKVTSFCQLLQDRYAGQLDERADQYIAFAVDGAKRMQQLINDLLAFSRVGRIGERSKMADLTALARAAAADLDDVIRAGGAEVEIGELPRLSVEPQLLRTVFQNLIANSLKFRSPAPPRIRIEAARGGERWLFTCTDNGIGIEPAYADRVFVIFQRLHSRDAYEGTGIGLAMCRKIIEFSGGEIWVDQEFSGGTRMCFTLPAEPALAAPSSTASPEAPESLDAEGSDTMVP
jgi:signal transduction histidine kinase